MADLNVRILGDIRQLSKKLDQAEGKFAGFATNVKRVAGGLAAVFAFREIGQFGLSLAQSASQLEAWGRKADVVFAEQLGSVEKWAKGSASAMGLTTAEAVNAAAGVADLLKPMGFTAEQAASMSTDLVGLSGALAEWSGGQYTASETADLLAKAMLGERDSLKSLGISINQAEVDTRALEIAKKDGRTAITDMDRALATQQLVLEKSTDAQAAFAEGGDTLARKQAVLGAKFRELQQRLAQKLIPVLLQLADFVTARLLPAVGMMAEWLQLHLGPAFDRVAAKVAEWAPMVAAYLQQVADKAGELADWFLMNVWPRMSEAFDLIAEKAGEVADWFRSVAWPRMREAFDLIADKAGELADWFEVHVEPTIRSVLDRVSAAAEEFAAFVSGIWSRWGADIVAFTESAFGRIKTAVSVAVGVVRGVVETLLALIRGDWGQAWTSAKDAVGVAWSGIVRFVSSAVSDLLGVLRNLPSVMATLGADVARAFVDALVDAIAGAAGRLSRAVRDALPSPSSVVSSITGSVGSVVGRIPGFHTGGVFRAPVGRSEGLALLRDGERILTPGQDRHRTEQAAPPAAGAPVLNFTSTAVRASDVVLGLRAAEMLSA